MVCIKLNNLCHINQISPSVFSSVQRAPAVEPWSSTDFLLQCGFFFFKSEISLLKTLHKYPYSAFVFFSKQSTSTARSLSFHLNRAESSQSNIAILMRITVILLSFISNRSSPSHLTKDIPSNISQVRTRSTTKKLRHYYFIRLPLTVNIYYFH